MSVILHLLYLYGNLPVSQFLHSLYYNKPKIMILNLTQGICENEQYNAFKFPGGELHIKFTETTQKMLPRQDTVSLYTKIKSSDDLILLALTADILKKDWPELKIILWMPYIPYQQADRNFGKGECFSLYTITNFINAMNFSKVCVFDAHSDVSAALLNKVVVEDNSDFITNSIDQLVKNDQSLDLTIVSPDAGAYKKIFKLCEKIGFKGSIECANKYRDTKDGEFEIRISREDFEGKDVLIVDDICMGGRTFVELAELLIEKNVGKLYLAVSHGIFSAGFTRLSKYFTKVFTTNSWTSDAIILQQIQISEMREGFEVGVYNLY